MSLSIQVVTNNCDGYNVLNGIFTVPISGTYVFTWTTQNVDGTYMVSEIVVNNELMGRIVSSSNGYDEEDAATGTVVLEVSEGDVVWIRTNNPTADHKVSLSSYYPSTFSGWLLY